MTFLCFTLKNCWSTRPLQHSLLPKSCPFYSLEKLKTTMMQDIIPNYLRQRLVNLVDLPLRVIAPRACMRNSGFSLPSEIAMHFFFFVLWEGFEAYIFCRDFAVQENSVHDDRFFYPRRVIRYDEMLRKNFSSLLWKQGYDDHNVVSRVPGS